MREGDSRNGIDERARDLGLRALAAGDMPTALELRLAAYRLDWPGRSDAWLMGLIKRHIHYLLNDGDMSEAPAPPD
jgi:hypothetical protein